MTTSIDTPSAVRWIVRTLEEAGHETWTVGGAVRDAVAGRPSGDWDLATHARPRQVRKLFRRTVPIGIEHGTVGVLARDGSLYEITTFRRDVETDGRRAVVAFAETLEDDLARRDFTINAIAWHPLRTELADPFGGVTDLERGVLRTVGDPRERFAEDHLRVLRALRFAGLFRMTVEAECWEAVRDAMEETRSLSAERVRDELIKILGSDPDPTVSLELYGDSGALRVLYPEWERLRAKGRWPAAVAAAAHLRRGAPLTRLAALLTEVPARDTVALLTRLRLSNHQTDEVARRANADPLPPADAPAADFRRWLSVHDAGRLSPIARVQLARACAERSGPNTAPPEAVVASWKAARVVRAESPPLTVGDLALDGRGLISMGIKPGPEFGEILESLLEWVLEDPDRNDVDALVERVRSLRGGADG